jgi:peptidoglycan hydrolase CwlO-like protein
MPILGHFAFSNLVAELHVESGAGCIMSAVWSWNPHSHRNPHSHEISFKINQKESKIDQIKSKIDQRESKSDQKESKIDQIKSKTDQRESKIDQIKTKIDQTESKIDQIKSVLPRTLVKGQRSYMWIPFPWNKRL